jgi:VanZ family protein
MHIDKLAHALEFGLLSYLLFYSIITPFYYLSERKVVLLVYSVGFLFAILDEYHQSFVIGRYADYWDIVADSSGIILVQWIILKRRHRLFAPTDLN